MSIPRYYTVGAVVPDLRTLKALDERLEDAGLPDGSLLVLSRRRDERLVSVSVPGARTRRVESGLSRDDAYRLVQRHALRAWDEGLDLRELARADPELAGRLDLDAVFDLDAYTRHVDVVFERLRALARRAEPAPAHA